MLTCIATGKSSAKSGGKNRSACFFENPGFPVKELASLVIYKMLKTNDV